MLVDQCKELDNIWVRRDGPYGKTATMTQPRRIMTGMDTFYKDYCEETKAGKLKTLQEINKLYPEIEVKPENIGVGSWSGGNQPTNPIIEVAGDGKTAKGMWNSNGPGLNTSVKDGKLVVSGMWFWRTYYVDFVKEEGKWKIWHIQMTYDLTMPLGGGNNYLLDFSKYESHPQEAATFEPGSGYSSNPNPYQDWSPLRLPQTKQRPPMPEPYYTFSETFSY
jgi:SnoaL-like domain